MNIICWKNQLGASGWRKTAYQHDLDDVAQSKQNDEIWKPDVKSHHPLPSVVMEINRISLSHVNSLMLS
jgi:hypothetical protein